MKRILQTEGKVMKHFLALLLASLALAVPAYAQTAICNQDNSGKGERTPRFINFLVNWSRTKP